MVVCRIRKAEFAGEPEMDIFDLEGGRETQNYRALKSLASRFVFRAAKHDEVVVEPIIAQSSKQSSAEQPSTTQMRELAMEVWRGDDDRAFGSVCLFSRGDRVQVTYRISKSDTLLLPVTLEKGLMNDGMLAWQSRSRAALS